MDINYSTQTHLHPHKISWEFTDQVQTYKFCHV